MCLVEDLFESEDEFGDDIKLLEILRKMPERLKSPVYNKAEFEELKMKNSDDLRLLIEYSKLFSQDLSKAINDTTITDKKACLLIQDHLGKRFPVEEVLPEKTSLKRFVQLP